jgi:hypothetical protein
MVPPTLQTSSEYHNAETFACPSDFWQPLSSWPYWCLVQPTKQFPSGTIFFYLFVLKKIIFFCHLKKIKNIKNYNGTLVCPAWG